MISHDTFSTIRFISKLLFILKHTPQAALTACSILGGSDTCSKLILDMLVESSESEEIIELSKFAMAMVSSPREAASTMLLLSRMVKGMICNKDAAANLHRLDPSLSISTPNWIYTSPLSMATITTLLSHPSVINYVAVNPSLGWALLESTSEVVTCCKHHLSSEEEDDHDGSWTLKEESVLEILLGIVHLLGCPESYGLSDQANEILQEFSSCFLFDADSSDTKRNLFDVHFRKLVPKITVAAGSTVFPWKETDPSFLAMAALLKTIEGSTVSSNFDIAAPFFIHHMSGTEIVKDGEADEYSLRITLMSLLQSILSDETFHSLKHVSGTKITSARFRTDIILSLVLPNLVWRPGGLASALRKLSVATVFCLLRHLKGDDKPNSDTLAQLIPVLHSCLEDTESTTRELACVCLSSVLEQVSSDIFQAILETDARSIDTLQRSFLCLLDDSHNPCRVAACRALLALSALENQLLSCDKGLSSLEKVVSSLIVHVDDDEQEVRLAACEALSVLSALDLENQMPI
jgi:hypothetical protein